MPLEAPSSPDRADPVRAEGDLLVRESTVPEASSFGGQLVARVNDQLDDVVLRRAYRRLHRKAALVVAWYIGSYLLLVMASGWLLGAAACVSLAMSMVAIGFNIQHDANHNAFFRTAGRKRLTTANRIAGLSLHAIGCSSKRWIDGHVYQHHASPNVVGRDFDIELEPFARLAPFQKRHRWHAFQHLYLWVLYGFTSIAIILGDVAGTIQDSFSSKHGRTGPPTMGDYLTIVLSKGAFIVVMLGGPLLFHPWWVVLLGAVLVLGISGFLLGVVFQLAHAVEEADFCQASDRPPARWHEWQVRTSVDFCHGHGVVARVFTWYAGGLNFQTEHHLFPRLPHTVYPSISPIVSATCEEFGIRYQVQPTLRAAIRSHYRHARRLGRAEPVADR